jgi:hypothetical protein
VSQDNREGSVTVEPYFAQKGSRRAVAHLVVTGASGRERRYALQVSGSDGALRLAHLQAVAPSFDEPTAENPAVTPPAEKEVTP